MTTGANSSAPSIASKKSARQIFDEWRIRLLPPTTGRLGSLSLPGLRERPSRRREVDSEALACCIRIPLRHSCVWNEQASLGARATELAENSGTVVEEDSDPEVAGVSSGAAQAIRVAKWHGDFSSGRSRIADDRWHRSHSRRRALGFRKQGWVDRHLWRSLAHGRH